MLSVSGKQVKQSVMQFVRNLKAGEHGCIFFTSRDDFYDIQFIFVKSGLEQNWGVIYATATEPVEQIRDAMQRFGIDVQKYEADKSLVIIRGEELYKNAEKPDFEAWTNAVKAISDSFTANGKRGVRVAADLSSYFLSKGLSQQWFQLEYALERKFSIPLTVICGYDALQVPSSRDLEIMDYYKLIKNERRGYVDAHSFAIYSNNQDTMIFSV